MGAFKAAERRMKLQEVQGESKEQGAGSREQGCFLYLSFLFGTYTDGKIESQGDGGKVRGSEGEPGT